MAVSLFARLNHRHTRRVVAAYHRKEESNRKLFLYIFLTGRNIYGYKDNFYTYNVYHYSRRIGSLTYKTPAQIHDNLTAPPPPPPPPPAPPPPLQKNMFFGPKTENVHNWRNPCPHGPHYKARGPFSTFFQSVSIYLSSGYIQSKLQYNTMHFPILRKNLIILLQFLTKISFFLGKKCFSSKWPSLWGEGLLALCKCAKGATWEG